MAIDGLTKHSEWDSYRDAIDQADMVHGQIFCGHEYSISDREAWEYARDNQGFDGTFSEWQLLDDDERDEFEFAAGGDI